MNKKNLVNLTRKFFVYIKEIPSFVKNLIIVVSLFNLFIYAFTALILYQIWNQFELRTETSTQNLSQVLEKNIAGIISKSDVAILYLVDEVEELLSLGKPILVNKTRLLKQAAKQVERLPELENIRIATEQGEILYEKESSSGASSQSPPVNISDRDYFIQARDNPDRGLHISKPYFGRLTQKWIFSITRRFNHPDGRFAGIVFGVFSIEYFSKLFSSLNIGPEGAIALRDQDMAIVVRIPEPLGLGSSIGQVSTMKELVDPIRAGSLSGTVKGYASADNKYRIYSYRKIAHFPLYILVGITTKVILNDWCKEFLMINFLVFFFTFLTVCFARRLYLNWKKERKLENDLREMNHELEERVTERTKAFHESHRLLQKELFERQEAEKALDESRNRFQNLFENAPVGIFQTHPNGQFLAANPALVNLLGFSSFEELRTKITNLSLQVYVDPEDRKQAIEKLLKTGDWVHHFQAAWRRNDSSQIRVDMTERKVVNASGEIIYLEGFVEDITDRVNAEKAQKTMQAQLFHSSKLAAIGVLASGVAHEINNPLAIVVFIKDSLLLKLKKTSISDDEFVQLFMKLDKAIVRMTNIVNGLRSFSRTNEETVDKININSVLNETLSLMEGLFSKDGIQFEKIAECEKPFVKANFGQLQQVLVNLMTNSRDALIHLKGEKNIRIQALNEGTDVCLTISDNGEGIPPELLSRIFEPFFTTKPTGKGTGLGLSISHGIISSFKGKIEVESEKGKGTNFTIRLPSYEA